MRNTAIMAGGQSVEGIMTGVADGYLLLKATNGQADSTTDFMFGISFGYEIHNGRLGRPVRDTTLSGNAIDVLTSVDAVGDAIQWRCGAYCGKKQLMLVSMGGPTLRVRARLGGVR
jgi:TldD protein